MAAISRKVAQELERTLREVQTAIQDYDDTWHKLKAFNTKHSEVIGVYGGDGIRGSQLITQRVGRKSQTIITNTNGVVEGIDIKHIGDNRVRIENQLSTSLRRLHRLREELVEKLGQHDLRSQEKDVLHVKKQIEMRYRRGKSFYLCGSTSEFCVDDNDNCTDDNVDLEDWTQNAIETMHGQIEKFNAVIEELTAQIYKATTGSDGNSIEMLVDQIAQHEALVDTHNMHISKLESVLRALRNGKLATYGGDLDLMCETLDPYINDNEDLAIIVHDEVYADFDQSLFHKLNCSPLTKSQNIATTQQSLTPKDCFVDNSRSAIRSNTLQARPICISDSLKGEAKLRCSDSDRTDMDVSPGKDPSPPKSHHPERFKLDARVKSLSLSEDQQSQVAEPISKRPHHPIASTTSPVLPSRNIQAAFSVSGINGPVNESGTPRGHSLQKPLARIPTIPAGFTATKSATTHHEGANQHKSTSYNHPLASVPSQPTILPDPAKKRKLLLLRQQKMQSPSLCSYGDNGNALTNYSGARGLSGKPANPNYSFHMSSPSSVTSSGFNRTHRDFSNLINKNGTPSTTTMTTPSTTTTANASYLKDAWMDGNRLVSVPTIPAVGDQALPSNSRRSTRFKNQSDSTFQSLPCVAKAKIPQPTPVCSPWNNLELGLSKCLKSIRMSAGSFDSTQIQGWWSLYILDCVLRTASTYVAHVLREMTSIISRTPAEGVEVDFVFTKGAKLSTGEAVQTLPFQLDIIYSDCTAVAKQDDSVIHAKRGDIFVKLSQDVGPKGFSLGLLIPSLLADSQRFDQVYAPNVEQITSCSISNRFLSVVILEFLHTETKVSPCFSPTINLNTAVPIHATATGRDEHKIKDEVLKMLNFGPVVWTASMEKFIDDQPWISVDWDYEGLDVYQKRRICITPSTKIRTILSQGIWILVEVNPCSEIALESEKHGTSVGSTEDTIMGCEGIELGCKKSSAKLIGWIPDYFIQSPNSVINQFWGEYRNSRHLRISTEEPKIMEQGVRSSPTHEMYSLRGSKITTALGPLRNRVNTFDFISDENRFGSTHSQNNDRLPVSIYSQNVNPRQTNQIQMRMK
eukprot:GHVH01010960.1.p1 GENE.GHVH01010960.1~~GHVH01010960.1.p1  ORF type:complete len:1084 (-),score=125.50 GHVH01010960.1:916-4167(-)